MFLHKNTLCCFLIFASFCLAGCSNDGLLLISGKITFEGTPLSEGTISFMPSGAEGSSTAAQIQNGAYSAKVSPGKMIIKIYSERSLTPDEVKEYNTNPMTKNSMTPAESVKKQVIPAKYNEKSTLTEEIREKRTDLNFDLK